MKSKTLKRLCCSLLSSVMVATSLAGCGNEPSNNEVLSTESQVAGSAAIETEVVKGFEHDPNLSELGIEPVCNEKITLKIGLAQNTNVTDYDTNALTLMLEELMNVDIEFHYFTKAEINTQIDLMVNAGGNDLPDIILCTLGASTVEKYGEAGMFIPLNEYYANSSYYLAQAIEKVKEEDGVDIVSQLTSYDGNIYAVPGYTGSLVNPTYDATWLYTPWLEKLGLKVPTTIEDFYDVLYAFKTQDPNGNGIADEIPAIGSNFTGSKKYGLNLVAFCIDPFVRLNPSTNFLDSNDGQLSVSYTTEEFKEGVKYVRSLVEENLIDPVTFSQDPATFETLMNAEGDQKVGAFTYMSDSFIGSKHPSRNNWTLVPPLKGADGESHASFIANKADYSGFITKTCKNPEAAFRLLDILYNEVVMCSARWGIQGENWDFVKNLKQADYPDYNFDNTFAGYGASVLEYNGVWNNVQNANWGMSKPALRTNGFTAGVSAAGMKEGTTTWQQGLTLGTYYDAAPEEKLSSASFRYADAEEAAEMSEQANMLYTYVLEKLALWCTGNADIEADWDGYLKELEAMGLSDWLAGMQEAYNR